MIIAADDTLIGIAILQSISERQIKVGRHILQIYFLKCSTSMCQVKCDFVEKTTKL